MEKAVLKTLIYADIFDYPLKAYEIHKWLIGRKMSLRQVEGTLERLSKKTKVTKKKGYVFLPRKISSVSRRERRNRQSSQYFKKLQIIMPVLRLIPWIKLIGISGGLAMNNADKSDDIDLFIITAKNRVWISRLLVLVLLSLLRQRRKVGEKGRKIAGKICTNILVEEDKLEQKSKDIYIAHEVLQMKVLWQKEGIYSKYLEDNSWVFKFLPNWMGDARGPASSVSRRTSSLTSFAAATRREPSSPSPLADLLENLARRFQLKIMEQPKGMERIQAGALYFHPHDCREDVLKKYRARIRNL